MKNVFALKNVLFILVVWVFGTVLFAQESFIPNTAAELSMHYKIPLGYMDKHGLNGLTAIEVLPPSASLIQSIEQGSHPKSGGMYIIGVHTPISLNTENSGTWTQKNGYRFWQLKLRSSGAEGLALMYSRFRLPEGSGVYVYASDQSHKSAMYKPGDNPSGEHFSTEIIASDEIILEYWAPLSVSQLPVIELEALAYIFRSGAQFAPKNANENGSSAACHVNVNCAEGNAWQNQKRGVAKIYVVEGNFGGLCTGSLVNNSVQDCKNYFLTAQHCGSGATATNFNQWQFYFNFESGNCSNLTFNQANNVDNQVRVGCTKRSTSGDNSSITTSDFLLLEFNTAIPADYNVFYNGWDRNNTAATSGVSIHHPSGDIKKISTYTTSLQNSSWTSTPNTHWRVFWSATQNGHSVTEPGSSGSPIFNQSKRIVGDLSGGSSFCNATNQPDLYGKFSYSWASAGTGNTRRLQPWLDPNSSGISTLDGKNACGSNPPGGSCDTVSNFKIITHTASALTVPPGGWISGTNNYGDLAKADFFPSTAFVSGSEITAFYMYFHTATGPGNVTVKIWNANGTGGAPGTVLAQGNVTLSTIPSNGSPLLLTLTNPIPISGNFYVGYEIPTTSGTDIALFTTAPNEITPNRAWEQYSNGTWNSYETSYGNRYAHAVFVVACPPAPQVQVPVAEFIGNPTTLPAGNNVSFTEQCTNNPTSFSWTITPNSGLVFQNGTNASSANPVVRFNNVGLYTVSLTATNSAGNNTRVRNNYINVTSSNNTSLENETIASLQVFPNPAQGEIQIVLPQQTVKTAQLRIFSINGQLLYEETLPTGAMNTQLDISKLPSGVYTMELQEGDTILRTRFIRLNG
jgi:PKD repeat protein